MTIILPAHHGPNERHIWIDALNVAYWCGVPPSLRFPMSLAAGLMQSGYIPRLYFDANAPYVFTADAEHYRRLLETIPSLVIQVPSGKRADGLMLKEANAQRGRVISRDKYRDYRRKYRRLIDDPARLIPGEVRNERIAVPDLPLECCVYATTSAALDAFTKIASTI